MEAAREPKAKENSVILSLTLSKILITFCSSLNFKINFFRILYWNMIDLDYQDFANPSKSAFNKHPHRPSPDASKVVGLYLLCWFPFETTSTVEFVTYHMWYDISHHIYLPQILPHLLTSYGSDCSESSWLSWSVQTLQVPFKYVMEARINVKL